MSKQLISVNHVLKNQRLQQFNGYSTLLSIICTGFKAIGINLTIDDVLTLLPRITRQKAGNIVLRSALPNIPDSEETDTGINQVLDSFVRNKLVAANSEDFKFGALQLNSDMVGKLLVLPDLTTLQSNIYKLNSLETKAIKSFISKLLTITNGVLTVDENSEDKILEWSSYYTSTASGITRYNKTKAIVDALNDGLDNNLDLSGLSMSLANQSLTIKGVLFTGKKFILDGDYLSRF